MRMNAGEGERRRRMRPTRGRLEGGAEKRAVARGMKWYLCTGDAGDVTCAPSGPLAHSVILSASMFGPLSSMHSGATSAARPASPPAIPPISPSAAMGAVGAISNGDG